MKRIPLLTLVFSILSVTFFLLLIFFRTPFPLYPLMSYQDALDILTPLVLLPVYWILFRIASKERANLREEIVFLALAGFWAAGQGMHLSANSLNNLIERLARSGTVDILETSIYQLSYLYDEHLSHFLWHIGVIGLAALLIAREWRSPAGATTLWWIVGVSGFLYGFTCFCIFLEGQTVLLGLPFTLILSLFILIRGRKKLNQQPLLAFFFISFLVAAVLLSGWGLYFGGFPQFSDVGLI
jgi:hypothetical protein